MGANAHRVVMRRLTMARTHITESAMTHEVPAYLLAWMTTQSNVAFIGDMLNIWRRNGGLNERQLIEVKVRYIQAGNDIPPR